MKQFKLKDYKNVDIPKTSGVYFIKLEKGKMDKCKRQNNNVGFRPNKNV